MKSILDQDSFPKSKSNQEELSMKYNVDQKISDLCEKIKEIKPLQEFLDHFSNYEFVNKNNEKISPNIYLVGGAVRDVLLDKKFKDYDFVVEGLSKESLKSFLESVPGKLMDIEGRNFGVFKLRLDDTDIEFLDVALPRVDVYEQHGLGHKDVEVETSEDLTINDDLGRRDFTINSIAIDLTNKKLIDPYGGLEDLDKKSIKAVGVPHDRLVKEDPTRMMRALRFAAKYGFEIDKDTFDTIRKYHNEINETFTQEHTNKKGITKTREIERVSREVIASEFTKGFYHNPHMMIELLDETNVYQEIFPKEIVRIWDQMKTTEQPKNFHSEGSVWNHTMLSLKCIDKIETNEIGIPKKVSINLKLAAWLHDFGKVDTIKIDDEGNFTYYNHPNLSAELATMMFEKMNINSMFGKKSIYNINPSDVAFIIQNHMLPFGPDVKSMKNNTIVKYYLDIIAEVKDEFGKVKPEIRMSETGIGVLQIAYIDANSSIKEHGPQDFTGLKNMIAKINEVKSSLEKYEVCTKYPIDGHQLMQVFDRISKDKEYEGFSKFSETGGIFFGDMLDYILEDALENPQIYKDKIDIESHLDQVVKNYIEETGILPN